MIINFITPPGLVTPYVVRVFNTLRPRQNGRRFADDTFNRIFVNENVRISIKISLKFVPKGPINYNPALVQIMAWHRSGDKPLSEPTMVSLMMHICFTRPQWVKITMVPEMALMTIRQNQCWLISWNTWNKCEWNLNRYTTIFIPEKCIWKCCLQ